MISHTDKNTGKKKGILSSYRWDHIKQHYAPVIIDGLIKFLGDFKFAYDVGCGTGVYIQELFKRHITCMGFELSDHAFYNCKTDLSLMHQIDVSKQMYFPSREMVISIEVAEHISQDCVDVYCDNLINISSRHIFMTSSNKPGKHHLNPQPREYWIEKITRGNIFKYNETSSIDLMSYYREHIKPETLLWFKDSVIVFERISDA